MKKFLLLMGIILTIGEAFALDNKTLSEKANLEYVQNDIDNASQTLLSIPEEERTSQNWLLLGNILHDKNRVDDAIYMYNQAIQTDPKDYKPHYNLGEIYLEQEKPNSALAEFKRVLEIKKDNPYARYNLACAYIKLGEYKKARKELLAAISLKNTVPEFHYNLAYVYKQLKNDKNAKIYLEYFNKLEAGNNEL